MKIEFHYTYLILALSFILTGYFPNLIIFTSLILVHEFGHFIIAKLTSIEVLKIIIYPYGGLMKTNHPINIKISKELSIALAGIIFQTIYFLLIFILYKNNLIRPYIYNLFKTYHLSIITFNILPIHPLDGSIILNLLLSKIFPYKITLKLNILISIITAIIVLKINYYKFNYTTILIVSIILDNLIKYYKNINYFFNRFLLERYLYPINYSQIKNINTLDQMYKEKKHLLKRDNKYLTEKQALSQRFKRKC